MEKLLTKGGNILLFCDHRVIEWFGLKETLKIIFSFFLSPFSFFSPVAVHWATLGRNVVTVSIRISDF